MWQREAVLEATGRLLDSAGEGRGGTLLVVGEAGLGKTSILDHARRLAAGRARVGAGRGDPMESALPFGLVSQALGVLDGPDLRGGSGIPAATPGATFYQVLRWIEAQGPVPILLALDDLHWADEDSLGLLSSLRRRIGDRAVAVMGTLRPWPPRAREVASALVGGGCAEMERLRPLSDDAALELLAVHGGGRQREAVLAQALTLCNGNCLLLEQVARSLRAFSQQENEKIWSFVRPFANKWVSDNQFTRASRVKITRADDGGALLIMSGLEIHLSCHQNDDQWWYYFRYRTNRPAVGPWAELDREPSTYEELTGQFVAIMDRLLDTHKA